MLELPSRTPALVLTTLLCLAGGPASTDRGEVEGKSIQVWTRRGGNHSLGAPLRGVGPRTLVLADLPTEVRTTVDAQVGAERTYRGISLSLLVRKSGRRTGDQLLLHFQNGMVVPVPRTAAKAAELDLFVATAVKEPKGKWTSRFPPAPKSDDVSTDPRPVVFGANKIVAKTRALPGLLDPSGESFSPWKYVDTLVSIEVMDQAAWEEQFDAPRPNKEKIAEMVQRGRIVYLRACQYCHGVRDVGASYGWDFVVPLPMHSLKEPRDLFDHVTVQPFDQVQRGLLMPTQALTKQDVAALWAWNKMLSKVDELPDYKPKLFD